MIDNNDQSLAAHSCRWHGSASVASLSFDSSLHHGLAYPVSGFGGCVGTVSSCMKDNPKQAAHLFSVAGAPHATVHQGNTI